MAYLVSVTPEEVLGPDVLVRVLRELFAWGLVGLVLPVLVPKAPGVDTGDAEGRDDDTGGDCEYLEGGGGRVRGSGGLTRWRVCARDLGTRLLAVVP